MNEEGRVVADPNILTDLLFGAPTSTRDIKVCMVYSTYMCMQYAACMQSTSALC